MKTLLIIILTLASAACTATTTTEIHRITALTVIYTDSDTIKAACQHDRARACFDPSKNIIYCQKKDFHSLGHEIFHVTNGAFHK